METFRVTMHYKVPCTFGMRVGTLSVTKRFTPRFLFRGVRYGWLPARYLSEGSRGDPASER